MKKHTTSINEKARNVLDISRDEYALCDYIQFRLADPRGKSGGWCCDTKQEIAEFIGISRPGLYKMIDRMEQERLIETDAITGFSRVTERWIDSVSECKQSLQDGVNKVYNERKQSLHSSVNKVTLNKENDIKIDEIDIKVEAGKPQHAQQSETLIEPQPVEAKKEKTPPISARPPKKEKNTPKIHPENEQSFEYFSDPIKAKAAWIDWIEYKHTQHREKYKDAKTELTKLRQLFKDFNGDSTKFDEAVKYSMGNLYKGIFAPKIENGNGKFQHLDKAQQQHLNLARFVADIHSGTAFANTGTVDIITGE